MKRKRIVGLLAGFVFALGVGGSGLVVSAPSAGALPICLHQPCSIQLSYYGPFTVQHPDSDEALDQTLCAPRQPGTPCTVDLEGYLYLPGGNAIRTSKAHLPVVVAVHGSTVNNAGWSFREVARFFAKNGYAFFALQRRGHGPSLGENLDDAPCAPSQIAETGICSQTEADIQGLQNLARQIFEVRQAIHYLESLHTGITFTGDPRDGLGAKLIDPAQLAILGHSLGGIISIFANTQNLGQQTVVDIAGASKNWDAYDREDGPGLDDTSPSIQILEDNVTAHTTPMMFLQPVNDCSTRPTVNFGLAMGNEDQPAKQIYEATLFSAVPGTGGDCGTAHTRFVDDCAQVLKWGPSVMTWMQRAGVGASLKPQVPTCPPA
jgi:pimeloyl-ACP methyl ester carboxylesterase